MKSFIKENIYHDSLALINNDGNFYYVSCIADSDLTAFLDQLSKDYVIVPREPTVNTIHDMHYAEIAYKAKKLPEAGLARVLYNTIIESTIQRSEER